MINRVSARKARFDSGYGNPTELNYLFSYYTFVSMMIIRFVIK
jgi:hypothetical protein